MRIIGLDLAITSAHKAVVMDEHGTFVTPVLAVATWPDELAAMLQRAVRERRPTGPWRWSWNRPAWRGCP